MKRSTLSVCSTAAIVVVVLVLWMSSGRESNQGEVLPTAASPRETSAPARIEPTLSVPEASIAIAREEAKAPPSKLQQDLQRELHPEGVPLAIFRGRLVYESTGQGVPWFVVTLRGVGRQVESRTTDEQGRFQSRLELPLARTEVALSDPEQGMYKEIIEIQREDGDDDVTIRVRVPPTFLMAGGFPTGLDPASLRASVTTMDREAYWFSWADLRRGGEQWYVRKGLREFESKSDLESLERLKREHPGAAEMVLQEQEKLRSDGPPWMLCLENPHETWVGTADVGSLEGVATLTPRWESFGDVAVSIRTDSKVAPGWYVDIELRPTSENRDSRSGGGRLNELVKEPCHLSRLPPGAYTLIIDGETCEEVQRDIIVRAGETTDVEVHLECATSAGSIRGEITSESGEAPDQKELTVELSNKEWSMRPALVSDEKAAPWKARFVVPDVPAGDIDLWCLAGAFGTEASKPVAHAGDTIQIRVLDRPTYIDLGFRVFDKETAVELESYRAEIWTTRSDLFPRVLPSGAIAIDHVPETGRLPWEVTSPGYFCARGNLNERPAWSKTAGNKRWIDVHLERGWQIECVSMDGDYRHLAGATIFADGVERGKTDADGNFMLTLPERPKSLEATYRDWRRIEQEMESLDRIESGYLALFIFERKR